MSEEDVLPSVSVCGAKPESSMSTSKNKQVKLWFKKNNQLRFHVSASCLALFSRY